MTYNPISVSKINDLDRMERVFYRHVKGPQHMSSQPLANCNLCNINVYLVFCQKNVYPVLCMLPVLRTAIR